MNYRTIFSILFITASMAACAPDSEIGEDGAKYIQKRSLQSMLNRAGVTGSIVIYDSTENTYYLNDIDRGREGYLPASTFKIPNTIVGLESETLSGRDHVFLWNGEDHIIDNWEHDMDLANAFKLSCVPCYQELARNAGPEQMRHWLDTLGYPGMVFDSTTIDKFWLEGPSRITPVEQVKFLQKLHNRELSIQESTYETMEKIMFIHNRDGNLLRGKTGWSIREGNNTGWFVGYIASPEKVVYGAVVIEPKKGFDMDKFPALRQQLMTAAIDRLRL